jgi:hypothetical protein
VNEFDDLELRLAARASAPDADLRGRVIGALERERRAEWSAWFGAAAACWLVAIASAWATSSTSSETRGSLAAELERGPDLTRVPRLARPIAPDGTVLP